MIDTLWIGTTWRRQVTIVDGAGAPVVPDPIVACLCPETPLTVDTTASPGVYLVTLAATASAGLTAGTTHWELLGQIGADVVMITRQDIRLVATCATLEVTP
jgi:hypothetical protein